MGHLKVLGLAAVAAAALLAFAGTASANPLTSPEGTAYTGTLKAESEGAVKLDGSFATVECKKSSLEGKIESHAAASASGKLSSLTFGECNYPVTVFKPGSLEVIATSGGNGTIISSGTEFGVETSVGECIFATNNIDLGTLTGSNGANATMDFPSAGIPRTGGNFLCGAAGTLTASYKVTTPATLFVDAAPTPLTSPEGTLFTSTISAESSNSKVDGAFVTVECSSSFEAKVESHSATSAKAKVSNLVFSGCNFPVTVQKAGSLEIHTTEDKSGTVTWSDAEFSLHSSVGTCIFTTSNTDLGTITDSGETKGKAVLDINSAKLPRTGGNFLCGASGTWTGNYTVSAPSTLYVDDDPLPPSPLTSPEGTRYTSTLKAESSNTKLDGAFTTIECSSSLEAKVESHTTTSAEGNVSSLSFTGCNFQVTVQSGGSVKINTSGAVTSAGAKISIHTSVGTCVFTTSGTSIGTLTDSSETKGKAVLDLNSAKLPRTEGNFLCGASGTWTGNYTISTPSTLYLE